jgi:ribonuclease HI
MNEHQNEIIIYTDGGSRGNPGEAAYGFVVYKDKKRIYSEGEYLGIQTNNYAEYMAVINAFWWVKKNLGENLQIKLYCDSLLVASQLTGKFKVKHPAIKPLVEKVKGLESYFENVDYFHVLRGNNKEADAMVNKALDERL